MIGEAPPAYLQLPDCGSAGAAFRSYVRGMTRWVEFARRGQAGSPEQGVPPVELPATPEYAEIINKRIYGLTKAMQPLFDDKEDDLNMVKR
jgi:hypothetical protein